MSLISAAPRASGATSLGTRFERLESDVEELVAEGRYRAAVALAQVAAELAWASPIGRLASPRIEAALIRAGRAVLGSGERHRRGRGAPSRVLHVLTEAYAVGGHTRMCTRWIEYDGGRRHDVLVVRGQTPRAPRALGRACSRSGGRAEGVRARRSDVFARAAELRERAQGVDLVVLHTHPFDATALLALGDPGSRPPTILQNHADHVFWLGTGIADVVTCLRPHGIETTVERRGVAPGRVVELPIACDLAPHRASRDEQRAMLGIDPEARVVLTAGTPYKYRSDEPPHLEDALVSAVKRDPAAIALVCGPDMTDPKWAAAADASGGRVRALGPRPDLADLYEVADVYVDSFPCSGTTTMLEAASVDLPIVVLAPGRVKDAILRPDPGFLQGAPVQRPRDVDELTDLLVDLLGDREERQRLGRATGAIVRGRHAGPAWQARLESIYRLAEELPATEGPPAAPSDASDPRWQEWDRVVGDLQDATGTDADLEAALRRQAFDLPLVRYPTWLSVRPSYASIAELQGPRALPAPVLLEPPADQSAADAVVAELAVLVGEGVVSDLTVPVSSSLVERSAALLSKALEVHPNLDVRLVVDGDVRGLAKGRLLAASEATVEPAGPQPVLRLPVAGSHRDPASTGPAAAEETRRSG